MNKFKTDLLTIKMMIVKKGLVILASYSITFEMKI